MPDHLAGFKKGVIGISVVPFNESQDVIDNGIGRDNSFIIAVFIDETIHQDGFEGFTLDTVISSLSDGFLGLISGISIDEFQVVFNHGFYLR
jgi:hypothetical protein